MLPAWASGMSSSTTTYIIAPRGEGEDIGQGGRYEPGQSIVSSAPMGSTDAGEHTRDEGFAAAHALAEQGHGYDGAFRDVLQGYASGKREGGSGG